MASNYGLRRRRCIATVDTVEAGQCTNEPVGSTDDGKEAPRWSILTLDSGASDVVLRRSFGGLGTFDRVFSIKSRGWRYVGAF